MKSQNFLPFNRSIFNESGGKRMCSHSLMLEAWRRGAKIIAYKKGISVHFEIITSEKRISFNRSRPNHTPQEAVKACIDKYITKCYLENQNIPVPSGKVFSVNDDSMLEYARKIGYPLVLKPVDGTFGKDVFVSIVNEEELIKIRNQNKKRLNRVILEQHVEGNDYRIFVVGNKVIGAIQRKPAFVVGDGIHTIEELINIKNKERKINPYFSSKLIEITPQSESILLKQGYMKNSIPSIEEKIFIHNIANASLGGDTIDVTAHLTDNMKEVLVKAVKSVPGLYQAGIDVISKNFGSKDETFKIIEMNSRAELGIHYFPSEGIARDVSKEIIDYYFKELERADYGYHFNYKKIEQALESASINKIELPKYPGQLHKGYLLVNNGAFKDKKAIMRSMRKFNLSGKIIYITKDELTKIYIRGSDKNINEFFERNHQVIKHYKVTPYNKSIQIGVYMITS